MRDTVTNSVTDDDCPADDISLIDTSEVGPHVEQLAALHARLCPKQVLGARMALAAARTLPCAGADKRVLVILETDGCFADGVSVVSGCSVGHRTLRVVDLGKIAGTFVDTHTGRAVRFWPRATAREEALRFAPNAPSAWHAQRIGYALMPAADLFEQMPVCLLQPLTALLGRPHQRATCAGCGEEVLNQREERRAGAAYCRACLGNGYLAPYQDSSFRAPTLAPTAASSREFPARRYHERMFDHELLQAIATEQEVGFTTFGRKTGNPSRRIIWITSDGQRVYIRSGQGLGRDWPRNLLANGRATLHVQGRDVPVQARHVTDAAEARASLAEVLAKYDTPLMGSREGEPLTPAEQATFELLPAST